MLGMTGRSCAFGAFVFKRQPIYRALVRECRMRAAGLLGLMVVSRRVVCEGWAGVFGVRGGFGALCSGYCWGTWSSLDSGE